MSGLALLSSSLGAQVSGSEHMPGRFTEMVQEHGIPVTFGHDTSHVPPEAELVYSTAIAAENRRAAASSRGQPQIHRGELLQQICTLRRCIAIAGTHGKTTTSAMIVHSLSAAGKRVGYVIGGILLNTIVGALTLPTFRVWVASSSSTQQARADRVGQPTTSRAMTMPVPTCSTYSPREMSASRSG